MESRRWSTFAIPLCTMSWTERTRASAWLCKAGSRSASGASSSQVSFQKSVLRPSPTVTEVIRWYAGNSWRRADQ